MSSFGIPVERSITSASLKVELMDFSVLASWADELAEALETEDAPNEDAGIAGDADRAVNTCAELLAAALVGFVELGVVAMTGAVAKTGATEEAAILSCLSRLAPAFAESASELALPDTIETLDAIETLDPIATTLLGRVSLLKISAVP